jgi:heavy metal translocating P-type ATPase
VTSPAIRNRRGELELRSIAPGRIRLRARGRDGASSWREDLGWLAEAGLAEEVEVREGPRSILLRYDAERHPEILPIVSRLAERGVSIPDRFRHRSAAPAAVGAVGWAVRSEVPGRLRLWHAAIGYSPAARQRMEVALLSLDGVRSYTFSRHVSTVLVRFDPRSLAGDAIREALEAALAGREAPGRGEVSADDEIDEATFNLTASTGALGLALAAGLAPPLGPLAFLATALASLHIDRDAVEALLKERRLKVDVLDATVVTLALTYNYVLAAAFMVWVVDAADVMLARATHHSRELLTEVFGRQVRFAWLLVDGEEVKTDVVDLEPGDQVVVKAGEPIPVDGVVVAGDAMVDQQALTGEFDPAERSAGEPVFALTSVLAGRLVIEARQTGSETRAAQVVRIIEDAVEHKVRLQSLSEVFADAMVVPTLALGAVGRVFVGPGAMLAIINADFGTGIRIAGPLALFSSLSVAARNGVVVKNGGVLESLHTIDAMIFDKTGTLTEETPVVERVLSLDPAIDEDQLLSWVACAERRFAHPIARAIAGRALERGLDIPTVAEGDFHVGFGIEVRLGDAHLQVGSRRYMEREGVPIPAAVGRRVKGGLAGGGSIVYAAVDGKLTGLIELRASARPEAARIIDHLRERGIERIYLISGDNEAATRALAEKLGIDDYFAEVLPEHKARYVDELRSQGLKVGMVGDGINDSAALARADYSFSLRGAADVATDVADVVFMHGDLSRFELLFEISEGLQENVQRSFLLTLVPNSICIVGALAGVFGLGVSLVLNNVFNLVATLNGLLPMYGFADQDAK